MANRRANMSSAELADSLLEFLNDDTYDISIDESIIFSTLIHVDGDNYFWNGELSQLYKTFRPKYLKVDRHMHGIHLVVIRSSLKTTKLP